MTTPTILVATWNDGLFAITSEKITQEIAGLPVRGLAPDGTGHALAIVGGQLLCRRERSGTWTTLTTGAWELSCCLTVGDSLYVGTENAHLLRLNAGTGDRSIRMPPYTLWQAGCRNGRRASSIQPASPQKTHG